MDKPVLLLNTTEEVLGLISWQKAIQLFFSKKVETPHNYTDSYVIKTTSGDFSLPTTVILKKYVFIPHSKVASLTRRNVVKRDNGRCQYCNKILSVAQETLDHVIPRSRGGKHDWQNVVACCKPCNTKKAARTPVEAGMRLLKDPFAPTQRIIVFQIVENKLRDSWKRWVKV